MGVLARKEIGTSQPVLWRRVAESWNRDAHSSESIGFQWGEELPEGITHVIRKPPDISDILRESAVFKYCCRDLCTSVCSNHHLTCRTDRSLKLDLRDRSLYVMGIRDREEKYNNNLEIVIKVDKNLKGYFFNFVRMIDYEIARRAHISDTFFFFVDNSPVSIKILIKILVAECIEMAVSINFCGEWKAAIFIRESPAVIEHSCRFHQSSKRGWVEWADGRKCPFARCSAYPRPLKATCGS